MKNFDQKRKASFLYFLFSLFVCVSFGDVGKKTSCSPKLKATFFVRAALSNADFCQLSVQFCFIQERQEMERQVQGTESREQRKRGQFTVVGHG
jgi:hypothetical protein